MGKDSILIIGKIPPPIGGVTIHVSRLIQSLTKRNIKYKCVTPSIKNLPTLMKMIIELRVCHLHVSNIYLQLFLSIWSKIFRKVLITTFHGDVSRYNSFGNLIVKQSIKLANYPILLNQGSFLVARSLNKHSVLFSSFIPPQSEDRLPEDVVDTIIGFRMKFKKIFCTSATGITFDKDGNEIYGVFGLIDFFHTEPEYGLILSDSSSDYINYVREKGIKISENILFISQPHSMYEVLKLSDGFIRNTSTDGDSIAIKESLYLGKLTLVTDVVERPKGVILFKRDDFLAMKKSFTEEAVQAEVEDGSLQIFNLYNNI